MLNDKYVGQLTFIRVYSGVVKSGDTVLNSVKGTRERIGRLVQMTAADRTEIEEVRAGDIAAAIGLKDVTTGETLCAESAPIILERMEFPEPVIHIAVEPKTKADQEKMGIALNRLAKKTLLSAFVQTKNPVKPLFPVWVSCTWKLLLTV